MQGRLSALLLVLFTVVLIAGVDCPGGQKVGLVFDQKDAKIRFAAGDIKKALLDASYDIVGGDAGKRIVFEIFELGMGPQSFRIRKEGEDVIKVVGGDSLGAMYGGLELAEMITLEGGLEAIQEKARKPYLARRGLKFNIPFDGRGPSYDDTGTSAQKNIAVMWDFVDANNVDLAKIRKVTIGIGDRAAGSGVGYGDVYIDNIRLYSPRCVPSMLQPLAADLDSDCDVDYEDVDIMGGDWLDSDYEILASPPAVDPVAHYEFEGDFTDSSSNAIHGTPYGSVYTSYDADLGSDVAIFDGAGDYVDCGSSGFDVTNAITVCAWVWHEAFVIGNQERYVTVRSEVAVIRKEGDGRLHFYIKTDGSLEHLRFDVLTEGQWHHVAGTWDGLTQRLYINGMEIGSQEPGGVLDDTSGVHISSGSESLNGRLDDVRIYDYALTQGQIITVRGIGAYIAVTSPANISDDEDEGERIVNFKDFAVMAAERWFEEQLWP